MLGKAIPEYILDDGDRNEFLLSSVYYLRERQLIFSNENVFVWLITYDAYMFLLLRNTRNKGNNKITELRTILQRESQNS
jgi:hypothetical protein